jgi:hypothetical protein
VEKPNLFGFFPNAAYLHGAKRRKVRAKYQYSEEKTNIFALLRKVFVTSSLFFL